MVPYSCEPVIACKKCNSKRFNKVKQFFRRLHSLNMLPRPVHNLLKEHQEGFPGIILNDRCII
jgi:hypothetical protein